MRALLPEPGEEGEHLTLVSLKGDPTFPGLGKQESWTTGREAIMTFRGQI